MKQCADGFLSFGGLAKRAVYQTSLAGPPFVLLAELVNSGTARYLSRHERSGAPDRALWLVANDQARKGWLDGPRPNAVGRRLFVDGGEIQATTAFRCSVPREARLRVVGDLEKPLG